MNLSYEDVEIEGFIPILVRVRERRGAGSEVGR